MSCAFHGLLLELNRPDLRLVGRPARRCCRRQNQRHERQRRHPFHRRTPLAATLR